MGSVLVTGGAGLLGTCLTRKLDGLGWDVLSSSFSRPPAEDVARLYGRFDFTRYEDCLAATRDRDCVLICAVQASGVKGVRQSPTASIMPNLQIHAGLLEACSENGVDRVVWISSSSVYQEAAYPIAEHQLDLNLPTYELYQGIGWVYRYLEQLAQCYFDKRGLNVGVIRTANIYGPYDRFDDEKSHVIPALIKRALGKETPFVVWGDGETVRDFVYVEDLAEAVVRYMDAETPADPVNFSSGVPVTIGELVEVVLDVCDHRVAPAYDPSKPVAVPYRVLDNAKFNASVAEIPRTPLREGLGKTVEWYLSAAARD